MDFAPFLVKNPPKNMKILKKFTRKMNPSVFLRRGLLIICATVLSVSMYAIPMEALADSLTVLANQHVAIGKVGVKRIRTSGNTARVYTDKALSCLSLSPAEQQEMRRQVSLLLFGNTKGNIQLYTDGYEIGELTTPRFNKSLGRAHVPTAVQPLVENTDRPYSCPDGLDGRHIALWGSHGWYYNNQLDRWLWQRAKLWTTVEDLYTSSYTMPYLVPMLENAGAVVLQPRERDTQAKMVVIDSTMLREEAEGITLAECTVPKDGEYAVYVWYNRLSNNRTLLEVEHRDQKTRYNVNMQIGHDTWVYVGKHDFSPAQPARVRIHTDKKNIVAVRLGGGIDTLAGVPRYVVGASEYLKFAGIPDTILNYTNGENTYTNDYACRGRWVNYLLGGSQLAPKDEGLHIPVDLSMAFHSDAGTRGGDTIIGTLLIYYNKDDDNSKQLPLGDSRLHCRYLGDYVQTQIVEDMRALHTPQWTRRSLKNSGYAEARQPKVPCFLLELLSHQNLGDMRYGLDPNVKFTISRAIYKGILKYLAVARGENYVVQPLPVQAFGVSLREAENSNRKDSIILRWRPTDDPLEPTAKADYYIVYTRRTQDGTEGGWDNGTRVQATRYAIAAQRGVRYDLRVVAGNKGGVSMPSETHCAYIAPQAKSRVLIVNNFNRVAAPDIFADSLYAGISAPGVPDGIDISYIGEQYDYQRNSEWLSDDNCGWGASYSDKQFTLTAGNTHDYPVMHGRALAELGISFCSCSAQVLEDSAALNRYQVIDLICGKQRTERYQPFMADTILTRYEVFPTPLRQALCDFTAQGGNLLLSGMYIGSETIGMRDTTFLRHVLRYTYRGDHSTRNGTIHLNRNVLPIQLVKLRTQLNPDIIHCENPQGLMPAYGAQAIGTYTDSGMYAGITYNGNYRLMAFPFMIESTEDFGTLYKNCIHQLTK